MVSFILLIVALIMDNSFHIFVVNVLCLNVICFLQNHPLPLDVCHLRLTECASPLLSKDYVNDNTRVCINIYVYIYTCYTHIYNTYITHTHKRREAVW